MASSNERRAGRAHVLAWVSATWAVAFGVLHIAWNAGSRVAIVDSEAADVAFGQGWFQAYNLTVALACFVLVGAAFGAHAHRVRPQRAARLVVAVASVLLTLRGAIGVAQLAWLSGTGGRSDPVAAWWVDGYMLAGGLLCALLLRRRPAAHGEPQGAG